MISGYFCRVREFLAQRYRQRVRVEGESGMDNLMGTMIGVLFLAVISASFAGIFMAYTVSTAKAAENTQRTNAVVKYSTNTLNNLYIESVNGKNTAQSAGWTVKSHLKALSLTTTLGASSDFAGYTYAATRPLVTGGTILVSQWGKNENGLVTILTAVPKAGSAASKCDWSEKKDRLETLCTVSIDTLQSVISPPMSVKDEKGVRWAEQIVQYPWTDSAFDWSSATKRTVTTSKLGVINTTGLTSFKFVVMFDNLEPGKKVSLDFVESKNGTVSTRQFTPTLNEGETGKVTRSSQGSITVPAGTDTVSIYLDTDVASTSNDPTIGISRFVVYKMK